MSWRDNKIDMLRIRIEGKPKTTGRIEATPEMRRQAEARKQIEVWKLMKDVVEGDLW